MPSPLAPAAELWWGLLLTIGGGGVIAVALAALAERRLRAGVWQRTLWRAALLGLLAIAASQLTGLGTVVVAGGRGALSSAMARVERSPIAVSRLSPTSEASSPATLAKMSSVDSAASMGASVNEPAGEPRAPKITPAEEPRPSQGVWWPAAIWAAGLATVLGWIAWSQALLWGFRRQCRRPMDEEGLRRMIGPLAERLGLRRPIRVLISARLSAPVTFGVLRPTLVLPAGFARMFDGRRPDAVLAHELGHLAAHDPLWLMLATALCGLLWWHPAAWWARRRLRAASESAADEASLLVPGGPGLLAESLVAVGHRLARSRSPAWLSVEGGFRSGLGRRVHRLLGLGERPWRRPRRAKLIAVEAFLLAAFTFSAILGMAWATSPAPVTQGESVMGVSMKLWKSSWRSSFAAAALSAALAGPSTQAAEPAAAPKSEPAVVIADRTMTMKERMTFDSLRNIDMAIHRYAQTHHRLPPAYSVDEEGNPLLSWRVLILPYLPGANEAVVGGSGERPIRLHEAFHYDEPWNSPHNKRLLQHMPSVFWSPCTRNEGWKTNYLGVAGKDMMFPGKEPLRYEDVTDGLSVTILLVEVNDDRAVEWSRPGDFQPDRQHPAKGLGQWWRPNGPVFMAAMADGRVRMLSTDAPAETLWRLFVRNDGQLVAAEQAEASVKQRDGANAFRGKTLRQWALQTRSEDEAVEEEARRALRDSLPGSLPAMIKMLEDEDSGVRGAAAWALQELGPAAKPAVPALLELLKRQKTSRSRMAPGVGSALHDVIGYNKSTIPAALLELLKDENANVRRGAAFVVGDLTYPIPGIEVTKDDPQGYYEVVDASAAVPILKALLKDEDSGVRGAAAKTLLKMSLESRPELVPVLTELLGDKDDNVRWMALWDLREIGPDAKAALPAMRKMIHDSGFGVRENIAEAFEHIDPEAVKEAAPELRDLLKDKDPGVRQRTALVLFRLSPESRPAVIAAMLEMLNDKSVGFRARSAQVLGEIGPDALGDDAVKQAVPAIKKLLQEIFQQGNWCYRLDTAEALAKLDPESKPLAVAAMIELLKDSYHGARRCTVEHLAKMGPDARAAVPALTGLLKDNHEQVRAAAKKALEEIQAGKQ